RGIHRRTGNILARLPRGHLRARLLLLVFQATSREEGAAYVRDIQKVSRLSHFPPRVAISRLPPRTAISRLPPCGAICGVAGGAILSPGCCAAGAGLLEPSPSDFPGLMILFSKSLSGCAPRTRYRGRDGCSVSVGLQFFGLWTDPIASPRLDGPLL